MSNTDGHRPRREGVITGRIWAGIFFVGAVMAAGTARVASSVLWLRELSKIMTRASARADHGKPSPA